MRVKDAGAGSSGQDREVQEGEEQFEVGPWYRIPPDYVVGRIGETYLPKYERKTIKIRGDSVDIVDGERDHPKPGLGYDPDEEPYQWSLLKYDPRELIIENEIIEEKKGKRGLTNVYSSEVRAERRKYPFRGDEGDFDHPVWTSFNGQEVQVSEFLYNRRVTIQEEGDGAIYAVCPDGIVSSVTARVSGFATAWRHAASRMSEAG